MLFAIQILKSLSTEDAISWLSSLMTKCLHRKEKCSTIFLDFKKAFDPVSVPTFVKKMEYRGIRGMSLKLLTDYLKYRTESIKIDSF